MLLTLLWFDHSEIDIYELHHTDCVVLQTFETTIPSRIVTKAKKIAQYPSYCAGLDFPSASITFRDLRLVKWNGVWREEATLFEVLSSTSSMLLPRFLVSRRLSLEEVSRNVPEVGTVEVRSSGPDGTGEDSTL
jgi:hypothetical protein